jgi:predicted DNA-binding transcriptional regulator YafY
MAKLGRPPGAYTQYRRLSQLREMLESHPKGLSLVEIGQRLHVTERSVRRYLRELEREVDVERMPHPDGLGGVVVKIPTRDLPRRVKLHRTQIYGLLMARRVFKMLEGTTFEHTLRDAVDQLLAHVQRSPRRGATLDPDTRLEDRFLYLPATPMKPLVDDAAEVLDTMLDACAQLRECVIKYRKASGPRAAKAVKAKDGTEILHVHPYAVVLYKDAIYCVCFVKERGAVRTLRMDRIVDADASPVSHFTLPDGFSVDRHFEGAFGVHAGDAPTRVVIDFHPSVADYVQSRQFPGEDGGSAIVETLGDGGVRLRMVVGATTEVRSWVMSFGDKARVIEPQDLADGITAELRGALSLYEGGASGAAKRAGTTSRKASSPPKTSLRAR